MIISLWKVMNRRIFYLESNSGGWNEINSER